MTTQLQPGHVSPIRKVPADIPRPEYVGKKFPKTGEPDVKTPEIIERMRVAGRIAAQALEEVGKHIEPGVTTDELDRIGHEFMLDHVAERGHLPRYPG
jgi:methionyl aminopeptidase